MRVPANPSPRPLALPGALALAGFLLLLTRAATVEAGPGAGRPWFGRPVAADTDTVAVARDSAGRPPGLPLDSLLGAGVLGPDSLGSDSLGLAAADTVRADTVASDSLARLYFPAIPPDDPAAAYLARSRRPFRFDRGPYWRQEVALDTGAYRYLARETVAGQDVRVPIGVDLETYRAARLRQSLEAGFREIAEQRARQARPGRAGFGVTIDIPGGSTSPFRTLFGRNEVDLRVNGQANIDVGVNYQTNEVQQATSGQNGSLNPDFGQELRLGITGTIGDKLRVNVNYDTQNQFDFENQVSLVYTGYDDDIVQRIEAGNVFLQTPSELIRGGQRLFGLRSDLRFGPLTLTAVASQQDAQSSELVLEGGSQTTEFDLAPYDYEDNAHFFLSYEFYGWWDEGHRSPNTRTLPPGFERITNLEVWRFDPSPITTGNEAVVRTTAVALADLAEPGPNPGDVPPPLGTPPRGVLAGADRYLAAFVNQYGSPASGAAAVPLPDTTLDQYAAAELRQLRDSSAATDEAIQAQFALRAREYTTGQFRLLDEGVDYKFDPRFGTLSLTRPLTDTERLAVAYQYTRSDGRVVTVGDYNRRSQTGGTLGNRIVLKLLRASNPVPTDAPWGLTMRNIYRVGGRNLTPEDFDLEVYYEPSGSTAQKTLPRVSIGQQATLLQVLGLDRLNRDGAAEPDDAFDFVGTITVDPEEGRVIFPYREPFGQRLRDVLLNRDDAFPASFQGIAPEEALAAFAFDTLYALKQDQARQRLQGTARYQLAGSFRSAVQSTFDLGFGVVPNSVRVTAGGVPLTENTDYTINPSTGQLEIINRAYLTTGSNLRVEYERNQFASIGSKTLLGLRAEYAVSERVGVGATWMRLAERPLVDKYRIGEEPIRNAIYGLDARYEAEPRWITRLVDALPLLNTRAPSRFEFKGEFAQLLPGHPETFAYGRARDLLQTAGRDFSDDERNGIAYLDDFEGAENTLTLTNPGEWRLAAAPLADDSTDAAPGPPDAIRWQSGTTTDVTDPRLVTNWRGLTGWYTVLTSVYRSELCQRIACDNAATHDLLVRELYPDRQTNASSLNAQVGVLDFYFDPAQRGPYNVNRELETTYTQDPRYAWGGMVHRLPEGYTDFGGRNNIEFVQFIFSPQGGPGGGEAIDPGAVLYVDLGSVSEDVVPNGLLNSEDGIRELPATPANADAWGRLPTGQAFNTLDLDEGTLRTEDLGLDGLPSRRANTAPGGTAYEAAERDDQFFGPFVDALADGTPARALAEQDPAADDFHNYNDTRFFDDQALFPRVPSLQERFARFFSATELNGFESQRRLTDSGEEGVARTPDSEDLNGSTSLDAVEGHFRYALPLDPDGLAASPYFQGRVPTTDGNDWYLVRIPVRSADRLAVGQIQDFSLIESVRVWTTGHVRPATLRFATLELVGSQWLKSERVGIDDRPAGSPASRANPRVFVETVNNEENRARYAEPLGAIVSVTRDFSGGIQNNREQSIVLRVEDLPDGELRALYRPFSTQRLDLSKYASLRLFVHGEGFARRDGVRTVFRVGSNETTDYYEVEQPLYPFDSARLAEAGNAGRDSLWQTAVPGPDGTTRDLNSVNVPLSLFNQLKALRDADPTAPRDQPFTSDALDLSALPPGAVVRIRGNPSLRTVSTVVLGVRNGDTGDAAPLANVEVWFNELRVTGFDEGGGWSAYARTSLRLADVADLNLRYSRQTDGFGELNAGLGALTFADQQAFSLLANVNLHRVLPERFGWNAPLSVSVQNTMNTPRYDPRRGDIRVEDLVAQAEVDPRLDAAARDSAVASVREEAQTASTSRSIRVQLSKTGSRSPWLRYTLDGLTLVYTTAAERGRSPSQVFNDRDSWSGSFSYRLAVPRARTVRPLWFLEDVPVLGLIGRLRLNYLPQSFRFAANANRAVSTDQERLALTARADSTLLSVPARFLTPERRNHLFGHDRNVELQYTPLTFLALGYRSDIQQSLASAGQDLRFSVFARDSTGRAQAFDGFSTETAFAPGGPARDFFGIPDADSVNAAYLAARGISVFPVTERTVRPLGQVLADVFSGERDVITDRFGQGFTATLSPTFERVRALAWLRPQPIAYTSQFSYDYVPLGSTALVDTVTTGAAGVQTQVQLRSGLTLRPREVWRLFPFYRKLEEAERARTGAAPGRGGRGAAPPRAAPRPVVAPGDSTAPPLAAAPADSARTRRGFNPAVFARRLFLALTGVEDVTLTYNGTETSGAGGLRSGGYSLFDALSGDGPSLAYRLGLDRRIPIDEGTRLNSNELPFQDALTDNQRVEARTAIRLSTDLNVNLTWQANWSASQIFGFVPSDTGLVARPATRNGGAETTILALGGSYDRLLAAQNERLQRDRVGAPDGTGAVESGVLSTTGVTEDFRSAFVRSLGPFGPEGLFALPLPNWDVTFTGLSHWPLFRVLTQQVQLRHGYSAVYRVGYQSDGTAGDRTPVNFSVPGGDPISLYFVRPELSPTSVVVNERFQPLIGLNVTWKGGIQTELSWNKSQNVSLGVAGGRVDQSDQDETALRLSYSRTGLRLPFLRRRRLNNNLRFTLTLSRTTSTDQALLLRQDLESLLAGEDLQRQATGIVRLAAEPRLSYTLSNQVSVDLFLRYNAVDASNSTIPASSDLDGGVAFRVSFSN